MSKASENLQRKFGRDRSQDFKSPGICAGLYTGVVSGNLAPNQLVSVKLDGQDTEIACLWAAGIISGLLGFKMSYLPPVKTRVLVFYTEQQYSYIVGSYSGELTDAGLPHGITNHIGPDFGAAQLNKSQQSGGVMMAASASPPVDLADGEINIDNLMGVGLSLLRGMASIQASDLARVECHLVNDMVRIISGTFKHHSAFGDYQIVNDGGRLSVTWDGTSMDHEALGLEKVGDAKAKLEDHGDQINMTDPIDGFNDDGRWRFSQYIGWLGDFINIFVTDPVDAVGRIASDQLRAGKARLHINNDGAVLCQSVTEIALEKVVRIPVPIRQRRAEDPQGNRSGDSLGQTEQLAQWKPSDSANLFEMAFQLREYARWLNNSHSLARFRQMDRDFRVPTEAETPAPDINSAEPDKKEVNGTDKNWRIAYACIRIYRDGSIQTVDAYGNSFLSTQTGVQISSTRDLLLEAAGSVNIVAGRDVNILGHNNVTLSAIKEKIRLSAATGIWHLVQTGRFLVEFVNAGVAFIKYGKLNVDNAIELNRNGEINTNGPVTALTFMAAVTEYADDHPGHIAIGIPAAIVPVPEVFTFQTAYGVVPGYQSFAQSFLAMESPGSTSTWNFVDNEVSGKGSPWPGVGAVEKVQAGQDSLTMPLAGTVGNHPNPMQLRTVERKVRA